MVIETKSNLIVLGAGGHGRVVAEAAELEGRWNMISFLDDRNGLDEVLDFKVIGKLEDYKEFLNDYQYAIVAIGNNEVRLEWIAKLEEAGYEMPAIIHPEACVSKHARIHGGTVILAGAVVNTGTTIGRGCIVNINATMDHDCNVDDGVHISSGAVVRSMCSLGKLCFIGAGALVRERSCLDEGYKLSDGNVFQK